MQAKRFHRRKRNGMKRHLAVFVAVLSLLFQASLPFGVSTAQAAAPSIADTASVDGARDLQQAFQYICTIHGIQLLSDLENADDGNGATPLSSDGNSCTLCQLGATALAALPSKVAVVIDRVHFDRSGVPEYRSGAITRVVYAFSQSRAPPLNV